MRQEAKSPIAARASSGKVRPIQREILIVVVWFITLDFIKTIVDRSRRINKQITRMERIELQCGRYVSLLRTKR